MLVSLASSPASPETPNEDFVAATTSCVVLLDGAGTPTGSQSGCEHGVAWYVQALGVALTAGMAEAGALPEILASSIDKVRARHQGSCDLDHEGSPSAAVALLREATDALDYLILADVVLVLDQVHGEPVLVTDDREDQIGRTFRQRMDSLPNGTAEHEAALREYIETLRSYRNREGGFWVASTDPSAAEHATVGSVPLAEIGAAALLSDGASRIVDRFGLTRWPEALKLLEHHGPAELIRQVRAAEASDLRGARWPRGKTRDDATIAYCKIVQTLDRSIG